MTRKLQTQWKARANVIERSHKNKSNTYAHHSNVEANIIGYLLLGFAKLLLLDEHTHTYKLQYLRVQFMNIEMNHAKMNIIEPTRMTTDVQMMNKSASISAIIINEQS